MNCNIFYHLLVRVTFYQKHLDSFFFFATKSASSFFKHQEVHFVIFHQEVDIPDKYILYTPKANKAVQQFFVWTGSQEKKSN